MSIWCVKIPICNRSLHRVLLIRRICNIFLLSWRISKRCIIHIKLGWYVFMILLDIWMTKETAVIRISLRKSWMIQLIVIRIAIGFRSRFYTTLLPRSWRLPECTFLTRGLWCWVTLIIRCDSVIIFPWRIVASGFASGMISLSTCLFYWWLQITLLLIFNRQCQTEGYNIVSSASNLCHSLTIKCLNSMWSASLDAVSLAELPMIIYAPCINGALAGQYCNESTLSQFKSS